MGLADWAVRKAEADYHTKEFGFYLEGEVALMT